MILPLPTPIRKTRKPAPMRWDRYYDEPVPGDFWGRGPGEDTMPTQDPGEEPQRIH